MVTKYTRKNTNYDKKQLAKKLEQISDRVAARGIYISRKNDHGLWDLYDYAKDTVIFDNLPNSHIAEKIATRYNRNKKYCYNKLNTITTLCNSIAKHTADCVHYLHIIDTSDDPFREQYNYSRLQESKDRIREMVYELNSIV